MPQSSKQDQELAPHVAPEYDPPKLTIHGSIEAWTRNKSGVSSEAGKKT
jgi:hypothetical protein